MSDVNYRVHEQLSVVADLKVREAMDAIVAVVQIEVATAHGEGEKCARAEEAEKYKAVVEALKKYMTAYPHSVPSDCFSTGPLTGNNILDHIVCPGCVAERMAKAALAALEAK